MSAAAAIELGPDRVPAPRGRPRRAEADAEITAAVLELLSVGGMAELSMDAVARTAGVGKATIYRRWRSKEALVLDVIRRAAAPIDDPDTGSLRGDLAAYTEAFLAKVSQRRHPDVLPVLLTTAHHDPAFNTALQEWLEDRHRVLATILERAIHRGELPEDIDVTTALDAIVGPLMLRSVVPGRTIDSTFLRRLVDLIAR